MELLVTRKLEMSSMVLVIVLASIHVIAILYPDTHCAGGRIKQE